MSRIRILGVSVGCVVVTGLLLVFFWQVRQPTPDPVPEKPNPPPPIPGRRALLVGVTKYDRLPAALWLTGPGNDVAKLRHVLTSFYGFPKEDVVCLTEAEQSPSRRPTRENIERAFRQLAADAREGDHVFILIAGHGARQPELPTRDPEFRQPHGLNEIFLPADVSDAKGSPPQVPNAVVDVDFRVWLAEITKKKAFVWVVFDCCHSGDMSRGSEDARQLPPGVLVPAAALERAREAARDGGGRPPPETSPQAQPGVDDDRLVALYACRPTQKTLEWDFPVGKESERHGILSHTLAEVLTAATRDPARLTYRDLLRRVELHYAARGWAATPTLAGAGQDRFVFGEQKPHAAQFEVTWTPGGYRVSAGSFHGLTAGSVLVVYQPGDAGPKPKAVYAQVVSTAPFESVVEPCAFGGRGKEDALPRLATCDVERIAFKIPPLKVAVVCPAGKAAATEVRQVVQKVALKRSPLITLLDTHKGADWLIRCGRDGVTLEEATGSRPSTPLPAADDPKFGEELDKKLLRIYRAQSLIAVGNQLEAERRGRSAKIDFELTVFRTKADGKEEPVTPGLQGLAFLPGESLRLRVRNTSKEEKIDVALLVVRSDYSITCFYPGWRSPGVDIEPNQEINQESEQYTDDPPFGPEYLVAIAVPATKRVDFSALVQPGLKDRGYGDDAPLAQLLERALDGFGTRGDLDRAVIAENAVRVASWRTLPARKSP
jgi:hypothetical protein